MTGPIRPSIDYVLWFCNDIRQKIPGCKIYILYWETCEEDKKRLEEVFDKVFAIPEPPDSLLFNLINGRTIQQRQMNGAFCHRTPAIYKLFYGVTCLIDSVKLSDSDIVMRIRTDNYIVKMESILIPGKNEFLFCPKVSCGDACDWFGISTLETLKKLYYIRDIDYNKCISESWNSEHMIVNNSILHNVEMVSINSSTRLAIAREYPPLKLHYLD